MREAVSKKNRQFAVVATDIILLRAHDGEVEYGTQAVEMPPYYHDMPAFLGGVLHPEETAEMAARRIIDEKSLVPSESVRLIRLGYYDGVDRDPRGRVVSLAHIGILEGDHEEYGLAWHPLHQKITLGYDHALMLEDAIRELREHSFATGVLLCFLDSEFVVSELQSIYESVLGTPVDKRNFYKFVETLPVSPTEKERRVGKGRPAKVFKKTKKCPFYFK